MDCFASLAMTKLWAGYSCGPLWLGEDALERRQQPLQDAIHLGGDLGGDPGLSQLGGEQIGGPLTDVGEDGAKPCAPSPAPRKRSASSWTDENCGLA